MSLSERLLTGLRAVIGLAIGFMIVRVAPAHADDLSELFDKKIKPSIVYLQYWSGVNDKQVGFGTGFVVADPKGNKWIVTSAHAFARKNKEAKPINAVFFRLPSQSSGNPCDRVIMDEGHDLAMLKPADAESLAAEALVLHEKERAIVPPLFALGSAHGLSLLLCDGKRRAESLSIEKFAGMTLLKRADLLPFVDDMVFLCHDITIAPGYSGCPILTTDARVAGVQSTVLDGATNVGFAVHSNHIHDFDWTREAIELNKVDLTKSDLKIMKTTSVERTASNLAKVVEIANKVPIPVMVKLDGVEVEAPFYHHGYVERDARTVIDKYVQDKEWYFKEAGGDVRIKRLQSLLDRTRLARISNPLLGLQMLVPEGYQYSIRLTEAIKGVLVVISPPEGRARPAPYDSPLVVWATIEPDQSQKALVETFYLMNREERFKPTKEEMDNPRLYAAYRDRLLNATIADKVVPRFAFDFLDLSVRFEDGTVRGNKDAEIFSRDALGEGMWLRGNYNSISTPLSHQIRVCSRSPLVVVAHYKYSRDDAAEFISPNGNPNALIVDYSIVGASLSVREFAN